MSSTAARKKAASSKAATASAATPEPATKTTRSSSKASVAKSASKPALPKSTSKAAVAKSAPSKAALPKSTSKAALAKAPSKGVVAKSTSKASVAKTPSKSLPKSTSKGRVNKTPSKAKATTTTRKSTKRSKPEAEEEVQKEDKEDKEEVKDDEGSSDEEGEGEGKKKQRPLEQVDWPSLDAFRELYYSGTEWENYDKLFVKPWDFSHLEAHIRDRSQFGQTNTPFLFGLSEPTLIDGVVLPVPVIVVVDCAIPPPEKVGIASVQRQGGDAILTFSQMKMAWQPCWEAMDMPLLAAMSRPANFYYLHSTKRNAWLKTLKEEKRRSFDYVSTYITLPHKEKFSGSTDVNWMVIIDGVGKSLDFDWESDEVEDRAVELMEMREIDPKHKQLVIQSIEENVAESKKRYEAEKAAFEERLNAVSEREKEALKNIRLIKYYPANFTQSTSLYINRYYGRANVVFPEVQAFEYS